MITFTCVNFFLTLFSPSSAPLDNDIDFSSFNYDVLYLVLAFVIGTLTIYALLQLFLCAMAFFKQKRNRTHL
ncbi:hypothetical protein L596_002180 [Steinernema carpocapsae]|uniref:Uncharacterized protein n=1 Tax=Steinernema carpocapsae TaxID=34508 RepID=A0A4U8UNR4_STECR|nr:hypothetical protein L596_002180 [Steinernema carpocapsae]